MNRRSFLRQGAAGAAFALLSRSAFASALDAQQTPAPLTKVVRTEEEWKRLLTPEQYAVARQKGTEAPYSSPLNKLYAKGTYTCVCCDLPLFSSSAKFDSQTGWPSFWKPINAQHVREETDTSLAEETRTEVLCARCDAHLGHVFKDGPRPTGLRYCINGVALKFTKKSKAA